MRGCHLIARATILPAFAAVLLCGSNALGFPGCNNPVGPDVIVGDMQSVANFTGNGAVDVFSFGTYSCNIGNQHVTWISNTNQHPVVSQNMFKYKNSGGYARFEHVGQSWLKHTFLALTDSLCCTCGGVGGSQLGVGCADPYTATRNASQSSAGPKYQVNAANGVFNYPPAGGTGGSGSVYRRLQCKVTELEATAGGGGASIRFFGECQYVTQDDAAAGNKHNNASYREVSMSGSGSAWSMANLSATQREKPAIRAWKVIDPSVTETDIDVASDGRFIVSSKATSLGGGVWHYEYAVHNLNSHRSARQFIVPLPADVNLSVTNIGFHDVDYHDGDGEGNTNRDATDWPGVVLGGNISWQTGIFDTTPGAINNHNAIRWATLYNFRFDCNKPPVNGNITLSLYRPGAPASVNGGAVVPAADCNNNNIPDGQDISGGTSQDLNGNGIPDECEQPPVDPCDQADFDNDSDVDVDDLLGTINAWGACGGACPPYCLGDADHNCLIDVDDILYIVNNWGPCP